MVLSLLQNFARALYSSTAFLWPVFDPPRSSAPTLALTLIPSLGHGKSSVQVHAFVKIPDLAKDALFLSMPLVIGNVPTNNYNLENPISAVDLVGALNLTYVDSPDGLRRDWYLSRATGGSVNLTFVAYPREILPSTRPGPRSDLREDQGGLIGSGVSFIPELVCFDDDDDLDISVFWDLSQAPDGSKAGWTFGDGPEAHTVGAKLTLRKSVFAVGPMKAISSRVTISTSHEATFGIYWFGDPPFDVEALAEKLSPLFSGMANFFNDDETVYKIFIRRSTVRSYGGTAFSRSFIFEYYDRANVSAENAFDLLAHEMVHNWPYLDQCSVDNACIASRGWYLEGIAVYYAIILPYRLGIYSKGEFVSLMNRKAQAYYTSPLVNMSSSVAADIAWDSFHAQRLPYFRGFIYFVAISAEIEAASYGQRSVDDIVLALVRRRRTGLSCRLKDFLAMLYRELGPDSIDSFDEMISGKPLIIPTIDSLSGLSLIRMDMPPFELGFDEASISNYRISGLIPGSRAADAGLRDGDEIVDSTFYDDSADNVDEKIVVSVRRFGDVLEISYLPRAKKEAECYQWVNKCL